MKTSKLFQKNTLFVVYLTTVSGFFTAFLVTWLIMSHSPNHKALLHFLLAEDQLMETLALGFLVLAFCIALYAFIVSFFKKPALSVFWLLFPFAIFLLVGDETSFGRAYDKWYTQPKLCNISFDAVHDFLMILPHCVYGPAAAPSSLVLLTAVSLTVILSITGFLLYQYKSALLLSFKENPIWIYLVIAFVIFWVGGGIDLIGETHYIKVKNNNFLVFLEETLEFLAEYTVFFSALCLLLRNKRLPHSEE